MIKIGITGLGFWGKELLKYFKTAKGCKVIAAHDIIAKTKSEINLNGINFYTNLGNFFTEKMDAVVVVTPPPDHVQAVKMAAERGMHVLCEKPLSANLEDADIMIEACKKNNVKLMVAFKHRFSKSFQFVKEKAEVLGKPLWCMYTYPLFKVQSYKWKFDKDGTKGIIVENMVHAIDGVRYFFGDIERVYAEGDNFVYKDVETPDSAIFTLRFKNGAIGAIGGGCTSEPTISKEYLDMHFENGVAQIYGKFDWPTNLRFLMRDEENVELHTFEGSDGVKEEIKHFIECVENDAEPMSTGIDGKEATKIALDVIKSINDKKIIKV